MRSRREPRSRSAWRVLRLKTFSQKRKSHGPKIGAGRPISLGERRAKNRMPSAAEEDFCGF
jgi:hypothetical protein